MFNFNIFKSRILIILEKIKNNPKKLLRIFNIFFLVKIVRQFKNQDLPFDHLNKKHQIKVLFETFKKINLIFHNKKIENSLIKINNIEEIKASYFNDNDYKYLEFLFNKYGSDKAKSDLSFVYFEVFKIFKIKSLLEIGLGSNNLDVRSNMGKGGKPGASLRTFRDYLKIHIYGADVDRRILFNEDNISTFYVDQLNIDSIQDLKKNIPKLDLIIDDGLHQPDANLNVVIELIDHLNPGGILIIEDIELSFFEIFDLTKNIFQKIYNFKTSLIKMNKSYCFLVQKN